MFGRVGCPDQELALKRRKTVSRGRDFSVRIEFAAIIRMKAIDDMMKGMVGKVVLDQEARALDALRVVNILLRENASERCADAMPQVNQVLF